MLPTTPPASVSTVRVGILHSQSGTMALSEMPLIDAALMAIAEINQAGGVLGQQIEPIVADGASDLGQFEQQARNLIQSQQVATVFGCWTSGSRKAVKPVFEELNALLWYPLQYEGLESSPNIFYTGSCPNQQVEPAVNWLLAHQGKRFYLLGSDYVFPRTAHKLITAQLKQQGGEVVGEKFVELGATDFRDAIAQIVHLRPDVVFNTLNGDSNQAFYHQYQAAGITAEDIPILAVSVAEAELQSMGDVAIGHYASWSYFQSLDTPENKTFVQNFQARYGAHRVTSDPIEAAYSQVYLWKQAVESAQSFDVDRVRVAAYSQSFAAPGGRVQIEPNHHVWKDCYIGQIVSGGQFTIVYKSEAPIQPLPWMGVEQLNFDKSEAVIELLAQVSQGIQQNWLLEQKSRQLEILTQELQRLEAIGRERAIKLYNHNQVLTHLTKSPALHQGDLNLALQEITEASVRNIEVERASVWLYDPTRTKLQCLDLFEGSRNRHSQGIELAEIDYPSYFQALQQEQPIAAEDAHTDPRTREFSEFYLTPLGIASMLDTPIRIKGETAGVLCLEHIGTPRTWTAEDLNFARSLADLVSLAVEARERKQAELSLAESQRTLLTLMSNIPGIAYRCLNNDNWTMLFISEGCNQLTGYPPEAFTTLNSVTYNQIIHPEDRESVRKGVETALQQYRPFQSTYRIITATGELRWVWEQGQGIYSPDGTLLYLEGLITDVTARIEAQNALHYSEERWQLALRGTGDGIFDWNITTGEAFASARLIEMLGYAEGELTYSHQTWRNLVHPDDLPRALAAVEDHLQGRTPLYKVEYRLRCKDGSYHWILARGQAQWDENGRPIRMVGSHQDISDRKIAEEELQLLLTITQAISAAPDFDTAIAVALQQVCETTHWIYGEAWVPTADMSAILCSPSWYCRRTGLDSNAIPVIQRFREYSEVLTFLPGEEIPGQVWTTRQSQWVSNFSEIEDVLLRLELASETGLKAGFAVPIVAMGAQNQPTGNPSSYLLSSQSPVLAVLVFFTSGMGKEDRRWGELVNIVAAQSGTVLQQKKAQAQMGALFTAMTDVLTVRDASGRCLNVIPTNTTNLYKPATEMIGRKLHDDLPQEQADWIVQNILQAVSNQKTVSIEYCLPIQDKQVWLAETISPLSEETAILVARDISDRKLAEEALLLEQKKSEQLLLNILPEPIANQLKQNPGAIAEQFNEVTIMFADIVGFTPLSARLKPIDLVNLLNQIFSTFDELAEQLGLEKIKTIGDAYMVAAGLPIPRDDHAEAIAQMAIAMLAAVERFQAALGENLQIRIGINTGIVVAGVIGTKKFIYDLWGDAVNIASRMESSGQAGSIQVTAATYERLKDKFVFKKRGTIKVKGKGEMETYWLLNSPDCIQF
jgi:urea ABC transporter urea binding protein